MNAGDAVFQFPGCSPGAQVSTGRILTVHTPPGKADLLFFSVHHDRGALDKDPCVRCQAIPDIPFFGPVRHLDSGRIHFGKGFFRFRKFGCIHFLTRINTRLARHAFADVNQGCQFLCAGPPYRGRKPKPGSPDGSGRGKSRLQK